MLYREASAASSDLAGAARVRSVLPIWKAISAFPTAGKSRSTPILAMNARVGFETVPAGQSRRCRLCSNEDRVLPVTPKPEPKKSRLRCANSARGLETGQPPETVRGDVVRQCGVAARPGDVADRAEKIDPFCAPIFFIIGKLAMRIAGHAHSCGRRRDNAPGS